MRVKLLFFAKLREVAGVDHKWIEAADGASVSEVISDSLGELPTSSLKNVPLIYAVNEEFSGEETPLKEADVVAVMTSMSGG